MMKFKSSIKKLLLFLNAINVIVSTVMYMIEIYKHIF